MVRVGDLNKSILWYKEHFDYEEKGRWEADSFTVVYLGPENAHEQTASIELTYNYDGGEYEHGDAWGHLAVRVDDVYDAYETLIADGVEEYRSPDSCGGRYAFVTDPDGYELELIEREYGVQWSLDHTMVRVEDITTAIGWYTRALDYEHVGRMEAETFENHYMKPAGAADEAMAIELTYNDDDRSYEHGDAWGHLAIRTDDLETYWEQLGYRGAKDYRDPASCDFKYAFTKSPEGHEIEILNPSNSPVDRI